MKTTIVWLGHSIYDSELSVPVVYFADPVYGLLGTSQEGHESTGHYINKRSQELTVLMIWELGIFSKALYGQWVDKMCSLVIFMTESESGAVASFIYSWSISHILKHKFFYWAVWTVHGSNEETNWVFLSNFWGCFFNIMWAKKMFNL